MHPDNIWVNGIFSSCTISPGCILHVSKKYFYAWAMNMGFKKNSCLKYFSFILFFFTYTVLQIGKGFWNIFCLYSCKILKGWVIFKYPKISLNIIQKDFYLFFFFEKYNKTGGGGLDSFLWILNINGEYNSFAQKTNFFTGNTTCLPILDWELDGCVVQPNRPVCEHIVQEQALERFLKGKK